MHYRQLKSRPLNDLERRRLRESIRLRRELERFLREGSPAGPGLQWGARSGGESRRTRLVNELRYFDPGSSTLVPAAAIDWALSYGGPKVLPRLVEAVKREPPGTPALEALRTADLTLVLPREHVTPDFQLFQRAEGRVERLLVCLTGNANRLNVPVQLFHFMAMAWFDAVVYLRDDSKRAFVHGLPGIAASPGALSGALASMLPAHEHLAVLGTSTGGYAAAGLAGDLASHRTALFSPLYAFRGAPVRDAALARRGADTRVFFARGAGDAEHLPPWQQGPLAASVRVLDTATHGTLAYLIHAGRSAELLRWLAGAGELA
ncbi:MAG: hypothetical protein ACU85V_21100 [Gammaproteobacteria bacterium]